MERGKFVLLEPSSLTVAGFDRLKKELEAKRIKPLDVNKDMIFIIAEYDTKTKEAIRSGLSIKSYYTDRISRVEINKMKPEYARIYELWNWSIDSHGRRITDASVKSIMKKMGLEIRGDEVFDKLKRKSLGQIKKEEKEDKKGNWYLRWNYGWQMIPGLFGVWEKHWAKSRTYTTSSYSTRQIVDYILAELDGPNHNASQYNYNASLAYASDWSYIWAGQYHWVDMHFYARKDSGSVSKTINHYW